MNVYELELVHASYRKCGLPFTLIPSIKYFLIIFKVHNHNKQYHNTFIIFHKIQCETEKAYNMASLFKTKLQQVPFE